MATETKRDDYSDGNEDDPSGWKFESEEQKKEWFEPITQENCGKKLKLIREISGLSRRELAKVLGVSESTVFRIETKKTLPTKDFLLRLRGLVAIGHTRFSKMSENEKETVSEGLGASGGVVAGIGGAVGAISTSGSVAGLSAAGITSGLAALGGGTMLGGVIVVGAIPIAMGAAGYGIVKGIKAICEANKLSCKEVDGRFEISREPQTPDDKKG